MNQRDRQCAPVLDGIRVLIVEDEPFIAFDIADAIEAAGGTVLGPAMTVKSAFDLITLGNVATNGIEAAILDVNLPDGDVGPVIEALIGKGILLLIHTGAGLPAVLRDRYPELRVFMKPTPPPLLARTIAASLQSPRR